MCKSLWKKISAACTGRKWLSQTPSRIHSHKKNGRHSEEGACRFTKNLQALGGVDLLAGSLHAKRARAFRQKLVVGKSYTSVTIIDGSA